MPAYVVTGAQWGDEGKGKIVDVLAEQVDAVVRFQGGNNAGHTIVVSGVKYVLHTIPSGIIHPGKFCYIGNGVVFDPEEFLKEVSQLSSSGVAVTPHTLKISPRATLIMDYHRRIDKARENFKKEGKIGTTGRGIGPAYEDKMSRIGLKVCDLLNRERLKARIGAALVEKNALLTGLYQEEPADLDATVEKYLKLADAIAPFIAQDEEALFENLRNKKVLFEGAQGVMLDIDHGTYPFVTSSNTVGTSYPVGSGLNIKPLVSNIAVMKAYTTRVGEGPFPTHDTGKDGDTMVDLGHEYGATTARRRKCGWLDLPALRHAFRLNGYTAIALTKLDVLSVFDTIKVATAYMIDGKKTTVFPTDADMLFKAVPVYEELPGWKSNVEQARTMSDLPKELTDFVDYIERMLGADVSMISIGPARDQIIQRKPL